MVSLKTLAYGLFGALALVPAMGMAVANPLPSSAELPRLHDQLNRALLPMQVPNILPKTLEKEPKAPTAADYARFHLKTITVDGVTVYTPDDILPLFDNMTGQETSVAELYKVAKKLTAQYRNDGYILARAIVPEQDVTHGHVKLAVVEGYLNDVILVGDAGLRASKLIQRYAQKLRQDGPLHSANMEKYLLFMNDIAGVTARSTLKPADIIGASDLIVDLSHTRASGEYGWNNWGTRYLGPTQLEGLISFNDLVGGRFGWHDALKIRAMQTTDAEELSYFSLSEKVPLGTNGATAELTAHRSISRPGLGLDALDMNSLSDGWSLTLRQPLKRSRAATHYGFAMLDWKNSETVAVGSTLTEDRLRLARVGLEGTVIDKMAGINTYRIELSRGLKGLGASKAGAVGTSRQRGVGSGFWKTKIDAARLQRLNNSINFLAATSGQFSTHALLAGEEFGLGGENFGRGYDTSEVIGDHGLAAKLELQYNFELNGDILKTWQLFFFQDIGAVWNKDRGFGDEEGPKTLASNGLGARVQLGKRMTFDVTMAVPQTRSVNSQGVSGKNPTIFVRLKNRFGGEK